MRGHILLVFLAAGFVGCSNVKLYPQVMDEACTGHFPPIAMGMTRAAIEQKIKEFNPELIFFGQKRRAVAIEGQARFGSVETITYNVMTGYDSSLNTYNVRYVMISYDNGRVVGYSW